MAFKIIVIVILLYALFILLCSINTADNDNADYLIVLGHALIADLPSLTLIMRLDKAVKYLNKNPDTKVILSGGRTKNNSYSEAYVMEEYLCKKGIRKNRIIKEEYSKNTIENIQNCKDLVDNSKKIVVLSSMYHICRIKVLCKVINLKATTLSCRCTWQDLFLHLPIEEYFIIHDYFAVKKQGSI